MGFSRVGVVACAGLLFAPLLACGGGGVDVGNGNQPPSQIVTVVPLTFPGFSAPMAVVGRPFVRQIPIYGGTAPYTFTHVGGDLPPGLSLTAGGRIQGTPTTVGGPWEYQVRVSDAAGSSMTLTLTQSVAAAGNPVLFLLVDVGFPPFGLDQPFGYLPMIQGGSPPYTFDVDGLPPGVTFDAATGLVHGRPTQAGGFTVVITVVDSLGASPAGGSLSLSVLVQPPRDPPSGGGNCNSPYSGRYIGQFNCRWDVVDDLSGSTWPMNKGFNITLDLVCLAPPTNGTVVLEVTWASISDPYFGCQLGCTPDFPSLFTLPADPPTTPSQPSQAGHGLVLLLPNGARLGTSNSAGDLEVSTPTIITVSSALHVEQVGESAWTAVNEGVPSFFPDINSLIPAGTSARNVRTSWSLTRSNL